MNKETRYDAEIKMNSRTYEEKINEDYKLHFKYLNQAIKKIKRSVRYHINKGETDMWHSVKIEINNDPDANLRFLYYDFHILLDEDWDTCIERYEIDVYPVFFDGIINLVVDTSILLYQYHIPFKNQTGGENE
tara:strand:- start:160 stop:558 length:399 start_codon:yes stop_codon:yes gene_type:complete